MWLVTMSQRRRSLRRSWSQRFLRLELGEERDTLWAWVGEGEARFREGDLLALHAGNREFFPPYL